MRTRGLLILLLAAGLAPVPSAAQRIKLPLKLEELEAKVKQDSTDAAAYYNVALGYWNEERYDDAERSLKTALSIEPRFAPARLGLAFLPFARRPKLWREASIDDVPAEWKAALEESDRQYRHAFLIDPLVDLRIMGAVVPARPDFIDVQEYLGEAWALFIQGFGDCQEGRYEDCQGRFTALIREIHGERFPDRIPNSVLWYQGLAAEHVGKHDVAIGNFRTLLDRYLKYEKIHKDELSRVPLRTNEYRYELASMMQAAGRNGEATDLYHQALENDIGLYMAHVRLADMYEAGRQYDQALGERHAAVNANPDDPSLLLDLGITLGKSGRFAEADTVLHAAQDANPRDSRVWFWLGVAEQQLNHPADAKTSFTHFLAIAPTRYSRQIEMAKQRLSQLP